MSFNERVLNIVQPEAGVLILVLALSVWGFYRIFLKDLNPERHKLLKRQFDGLLRASVGAAAFFLIHELLLFVLHPETALRELTSYSGLMTLFAGANVSLRAMRIAANEFFFMHSKKEGVPLLLINVISLIFSLLLASWILTEVFNVQLSSILATSAVLTIVLGLALQDTLGNLFAAISLQIDKPFELGDWIELQNGNEKISGQVKELSWRATVLTAFTDETVVIPNRMIAQWKILNFSARERPFLRSHVFRLEHGADVERAKLVLLDVVRETRGALIFPQPLVLVTDVNESWIALKTIYATTQYGSQFLIADQFYSLAIIRLRAAGFSLATQKLSVQQVEASAQQMSSVESPTSNN